MDYKFVILNRVRYGGLAWLDLCELQKLHRVVYESYTWWFCRRHKIIAAFSKGMLKYPRSAPVLHCI